jgi:nucleoside-diphosphate-sugar epimerase
MSVFVTGASGFIGSAIVKELIEAGHKVLGLARSDASAKFLAAAGADVHHGSLEDLESLRSGASAADGVIHAAFIHEFFHDFSKYPAAAETDARAIEALGSALAGSDRLLIVTSGTALIAPGRFATEEDMSNESFPRKSEEVARAAESRGVRVAVVRLPLSVHGDGDHAFVPILIATARQKGISAYVGDRLNRWAAVHRLDAAHLYRLALEKGSGGAHYHGIADEGVPFREIAGVIGRRLSVPVAGKSTEQAAEHFGSFAQIARMDCPASSAQTQKQLGWRPTHASLIPDIDRPIYFEG